MPEWLKGADCKSAGYAYVGSNPTPSTSRRFDRVTPGPWAGIRRGCSSMVEQQPSKLMTRVRFPSPAPIFRLSRPRGLRPIKRIGTLKAATIFLVFLAAAIACPATAATSPYQFCLVYSDGLRSCSYRTLEQCLQYRIGTRMCVDNPYYVAPKSRRKRTR